MAEDARLKMPTRATSQDSYQLVKLAGAIEEAPGHLVVDASALERIEPFGTVVLATAIAYRQAKGLGGVSWVPPIDTACADFLREVRFLDAEPLDASASQVAGPTLRLKQLHALEPIYIHGAASLVQQWVSGTPDAAAELVELCLNELLQNVFEHSGSAIGCFAHARWFRRDHNVKIAVADAGIGVGGSLRQNPKFAQLPERELVQTAVTMKGATARLTGQYGGYGLKHLRELAVERKGRLTLLSGTTKVEATHKGVHSRVCPRFHGTVVEVDFRPGLEIEPTGERIF